MFLDFDLPVDYYLRVIELAILDNGKHLIYNEKDKQLDLLDRRDRYSINNQIDKNSLDKAIHDLFSHLKAPYLEASRLLQIIDQKISHYSLWHRLRLYIFSKDGYQQLMVVLDKLHLIKHIIEHEKKSSFHRMHSMTTKCIDSSSRNIFSTLNDYNLSKESIDKDTSPVINQLQKPLIGNERDIQILMQSIVVLLEREHDTLLYSEVIKQFLIEIEEVDINDHNNCSTLLVLLQKLSQDDSQDFQLVISDIIMDERRVLEEALKLVQSALAKDILVLWFQRLEHDIQIRSYIRGKVAKSLLKVIEKNYDAMTNSSILMSYVRTFYNLQLQNRDLWLRFMSLLLKQWLPEHVNLIGKELKKQCKASSCLSSISKNIFKFFKK